MNRNEKTEDIYYSGIKYNDYKAVIEVSDAEGRPKIQLTTWRADIITAVMKAGLVIQAFEPGCIFTIKAAPADELSHINIAHDGDLQVLPKSL